MKMRWRVEGRKVVKKRRREGGMRKKEADELRKTE